MAVNRQGNSNFFNYGALFDSTSQRLTALNNGAVEKATTSRESTAATAAAPAASASAPSKADAAPTGDNKYTFVGLCGALNNYEKQLVEKGTVEFANKYEVKFIPASLAASTLKQPGGLDKKMTPNQQERTAKNVVDPNTNSVNSNGLNRSVTQGTQIVQFIELVMRNSSYITDQQTHIIDPVTGKAKPNTSTSSNNTTTWFKISVTTIPISPRVDSKRNDYAYKMVYTITPFGINQAESQYFPQAQFRGIHKVYDYWFTGLNTQILNYEQNYNGLYFDVMSGTTPQNNNKSELATQVAAPWMHPRVPTTASGQSGQGASNGANNPASTLADYLYSFADQGEISLKIIGDPSWIQQGEILGLPGGNFNFEGFYPDGTINTDAQQAVFAVNWNAPSDYNLDTGLMNINAAATGNDNNNLLTTQPKQSAAYKATEIKSYFTKGRFEQELKGVLLTNLNQNQLNNLAEGRQAPPTSASSNTNSLAVGSRQATLDTNGNVTKESETDPNKWPDESGTGPVSNNSDPEITNRQTQPAKPAEAPTSNGDIALQNTIQASLDAGDITVEQAQLIGYNPNKIPPPPTADQATPVKVYGENGVTTVAPASARLAEGQVRVYTDTGTQTMAPKDE